MTVLPLVRGLNVNDSAGPAVNGAAPTREPSDLGNARRLIDVHGEDLRYAPGLGWLAWDGARWQPDANGELTRRMAAITDLLLAEALALHGDDRKRALRHALTSQNARRVAGALELAATDERIVVNADQLDARPGLLSVANGVVDLATGELRPASRDDLLTAGSPLRYNPEARCPRWEKFLLEVFAEDAELAAFVQRFVGYAMTGHTREHVLAVLYGDGANGKSVFVNAVEQVLGATLARTADIETFLDGRSSTAAYDLAGLTAARVVIAAESGRGRRLNGALVKAVTGGDIVTARHPYGRPFSYRPAFKVLLVTNHRPAVDAADEAIWRRLRLVPFAVSFRGREDQHLTEALARELPGVLAWAVRGSVDWHKHGLGQVEAVLTATTDYRDDEDSLGAFLADVAIVDPTANCTVAAARAAYTEWCEHTGERPLTAKALTQDLHRRGIESTRTKQARLYRGMTLRVTGDTP